MNLEAGQAPASAVTGASPIVTAEDVANGDRLFLGRASVADTSGDMVGQARASLLRSLLAGDEFQRLVLPALRRGGPLPGRTFDQPVDAALRAWAIGFLGQGPCDAAALPAGDGAELLAAVLELAAVREELDALHGAGAAAGLAAAARRWRSLASPPDRPGPEATSRDDLVNCYLLVHGREPESEDVVRPRPHAAPADAVLDFLLSDEFRTDTLRNALDGRSLRTPRVDRPLREWAGITFGVAVEAADGRYALLARVLRQPWIAARIRQRQPDWPIGPLAAALTRADLASVEALVERCASGVQLIKVEGLASAGLGRRVRYVTDDSRIEFRLAGAAAAADLVLLRLASPGGEGGKLYLNYGAGLAEAEALPLHPGEDGAAEVVIAGARRLDWLRWDPADRPGSGEIALLAAEVLTEARLLDRLGRADARDGLLGAMVRQVTTDPYASTAVALSRALSPRPPSAYEAWLAGNEPRGEAAARRWQQQLRTLRSRPLISVLTPTYNTPPDLLGEMIESVRAQVYPHWELCIADDASTAPHVREMLADYARQDARIRTVFRDRNGHISAASNSALALVSGLWTVLLDHDDLLRPNALLAIAREAERQPQAQLIYSDEDKLEDGVRTTPFFKPGFSPERLLAQNYINHLTAHRTENIRAVGGWREGFEGSQDYDLTLRIVERLGPGEVCHIPEILYHWRAVEGSTARAVDEKGYAVDAGLRALREHLDRTMPGGRVEQLPNLPFYRVRPPLPDPAPLVSLIIPTRDKADVLRLAVGSILQRSSYPAYEVLIVDNGSVEADTFQLFRELTEDRRVRVLPYAGRFNYSAINNYAARHARGQVIGLVNNDVEVITHDWMEEMVSWALRDGIGCVGAKLLYPDMTVQHAGVIVGVGGVAGHGQKHATRDDPGHFGRLAIHHNASAVTAACLLVKRAVFEQVNGLDERLAVAFNDVDFCLRVREAGYRHVLTPHAELIHHESKSRGLDDTPVKQARFNQEVEFMLDRWSGKLDTDPFYSPNLTYVTDDFLLGTSPFARETA